MRVTKLRSKIEIFQNQRLPENRDFCTVTRSFNSVALEITANL